MADRKPSKSQHGRRPNQPVSNSGDDLTALKESEAKYRTLVNHSLTGIIIVTATEIRFANRTFEELTGYSQADIAGMDPWAMVHPSQRHQVRELGLLRLHGRQVEDYYETIWIRKDGTPIWVEVRATTTMDRGQPAILANVVNINERKVAQELLHRRIELESLITSISTKFINLNSREIDPGINRALGMIGAFRGVDRGFVVSLENGDLLKVTHEWSAAGRTSARFLFRENAAGSLPWLLSKIKRLRDVSIPDKHSLPRAARAERELLETHQIQSLIAVPMSLAGRPAGFVGFDCTAEPKTWNDEDLTAFRMAAQIFANALERKRVEEALRRREEELAFQAKSLEEANIALKVLLRRREEDQQELEEKVLSNVKETVAPFVDQLRQTGLNIRQETYLEVLESNLEQITSPFSRSLSAQFARLTPKEIQIANLIKAGKTSKDIAAMFNVTISAVDFHRNNIRRKLDLNRQKANLRSFLLNLK
jgi:PAS domain S-box-containing protein